MTVEVRSRRSGRRRRGYVLLAVMAVSVLLLTVLGSLAQLSLRRGLEAADAERSLQQRWGAVSLERAMLGRAAEIFGQQQAWAAEVSPGRPPATTIRAALSLRGVTFDLLLADEDAKLNLNAMYHHAGPEQTVAAIARVLGSQPPSLRLLPAVEPLSIPREGRQLRQDAADDQEREPLPDALRSWGEVFDLAALEVGSGGDAALPNLTTGITCWGNGQLNLRRASDQAILAVASSVVQDGGARRLLQKFRDHPTSSLPELLQTEVSSQRDRDRLRDLLSESSTNFSIWIDASTRSGGSIRSFTAMQRDEEGVTRHCKFMH
jgi:hypothetical protein